MIGPLPPTPEERITAILPLAGELVCAVRDRGPEDVAAALACVPAGSTETLLVVLAAMVDPDRTVTELLAWVDETPVADRDERFLVHLVERPSNYVVSVEDRIRHAEGRKAYRRQWVAAKRAAERQAS